MKKRSRHDYFIYKSNPFRPLYMGGVGFRTPPTRIEQSHSRTGFHLWLFRERAVARLMAAANNAELDDLRNFHNHGRKQEPVTKPTTAFNRKPKPRSTVEDLI